jgi:D-alanine-D-alanine ligase
LRIGVTYNVRSAGDAPAAPAPQKRPAARFALPGDDQLEEFDAPETIQAMADAIAALGHEVELLGEGEPLLRRLLDGERPDLVWNIAEGSGAGRSREARVPAVLEMLGIPYTGSDPLTLAVALDKVCAKRLVAAAGVATPSWVTFEGDHQSIADDLSNLTFPVFAKPALEGSSKGILTASLFDDPAELRAALDELYEAYRQPILVEEFIDGDELTVGLVGNGPPEVLGIMRVLPKTNVDQPFIYSLEVKRDWRARARYECPAQLAPADTEAVRRSALLAWDALGCRDVARIDFRLRDGVPYFLEANPLPGLSPISGDLVLLTGYVGISYADLIARILNATLARLTAHTAATLNK